LLEIRKLPATRWKEYRNLRLEGLRSDPTAFLSSLGEEEKLSEEEWKSNIESVLFALKDDTPVGMIVLSFGDHPKSRHTASIQGFYVSKKSRNLGIGTKLMAAALSLIMKKNGVIKVMLWVNSEQTSAVSIYERAGFTTAGVSRKGLKVGKRFYDQFIMEKML
jgi:ribosomal protein S18 acetylase RimI-like enzyme